MADTVNRKNKEFVENNARVLALIDGFEALYDINLQTGEYESFVKEQGYYDTVSEFEKIKKNFFEYAVEVIAADVVEEDRTELIKVVNREYLVKALSHMDSVEYYFRALINENPIWFKLRIVYRDAEKNNIIMGLFNAELEMMRKKAQELEKKELIAQMAGGEFVATVNLLNNEIQILVQNEYFSQNYSIKDDYVNNLAKYVQYGVFEPDRKILWESFSKKNILSKLSHDRQFTVEYRDISTGRPLWFEMRIVQVAKMEVLIGITNKNESILMERFKEGVVNDQYALLSVDFDTQMVTVLKKTNEGKTYEVGDCIEYGKIMEYLATRVDDKPQEFRDHIGNIKYLQDELTSEGKHIWFFHFCFGSGEEWININAYTIATHYDGTPATCVLAFSVLDALGADRQRMQRQLQENYAVLEGMASEYVAILSVNLDTGIYDKFMLGDKAQDILPLCNEYTDGSKLFSYIVEEESIHPECREELAGFYRDNDIIKAGLLNKKKNTIRFRRKVDDNYIWMEMSVIKCESVDEEAHNVIVCFVICDEEVKSEQAVADCLNILEGDMTPTTAINRLLALVGEYYKADRTYIFEFNNKMNMLDYTYEWCNDTIIPLIDKTFTIPLEEIRTMISYINEEGAYYCNIDELENVSDMRMNLTKQLGVGSIIVAPVVKADEIIGFVGVNNPTASIETIKVAKVAASIAYSEILRRKENDEEHIILGKLSETFVSVYYVNLETDYIRTWKSDLLDASKESLSDNYSEFMSEYIKQYVASDEQNSCLKKTEAKYVLKEFEKKDSFSIEMTDTRGGTERIYVYDYIKVNESGTRLVVSCRDVTESLANQKKQQDQLKEALDMAEAANKAKSDFLFNMSHDIRTPMNAILGYTDIALRHFEDEERAKDSINKIKTAGGHLLNLINDILEMSRIESGNLEISENPMDMRKAVQEVALMSKSLALQKSIDFELKMDELQNSYIYADELHINEVLINLLSNAVKYTPQGGKVTYYVNQVSEEHDGYADYQFRIVDNGIGMSKEFQKHLFEAFTREESATVAKTEGAGLGLSIVKRIIDLAGGTIKVESEINKGSSFTIDISFKVMDEPSIEKFIADNQKNSFVDGNGTLEGKRILLVEDNEMNREIAQEILEDAKVVVETAQDGAIALDMISKNGVSYYDIILMDIQMPVMNGYEATRKIRSLKWGQYVPIIGLSANAFDEDIQKSLEVGMNAHIPKPINVNQLLDTMRGMI